MLILDQNTVRSKGKEDFLSLFPGNVKSHISNIFFEAVRRGSKTPEQVLFSVMTKGIVRLKTAIQFNNGRDEVKFKLLLQNLEKYQPEARAFALYCLSWESLPHEIRETDKRKRAEHYRSKWLDTQEATQKQRDYLKKLGWTGCVISKQHAGKLIERLKKVD